MDTTAGNESKKEEMASTKETTLGSSSPKIESAPSADGDTSGNGNTRKRKSTQRGAAFEMPKPKKEKKVVEPTTTVDTESEFAMAWICAECKEAECMMQPEATELMVCDGVCRRLFHYPCAGLSRLPTADEPFVCVDCKQQQHMCSICCEYGADATDVFPCKNATCGLFFHESCLVMQRIDVQDEPTADGGRAVVFRCPAHHCWTCTQEDEKRQEMQDAAAKENPGKRGKKPKKKKKKQSVFQCKTEFLSVSFVIGC